MNLDSDDEFNLVEVHNLLGNRRRLLVIGYLSLFNSGTTVEVRHVARVIRGVETETSPDQVRTKDYESAYNGLIQTHLPKLADKGLIEYNEQRKVVTVTRRLEQYALIVDVTQFITSIGSRF